MDQIIQLVQGLLGGGANNTMTLVLIGVVVFMFLQKKKDPTPTPNVPVVVPPKSAGGILDILNVDTGSMPLISWFISLPTEYKESFFKALLQRLNVK